MINFVDETNEVANWAKPPIVILLCRLKFDLVTVPMHGLSALYFQTFSQYSNSSTRRHSFKLRKQFSRVDCRALALPITVMERLEQFR